MHRPLLIIAVAALLAATPAAAHERDPLGFVVDGPYTVHQASPHDFTAPLGSDKGSFASDGLGTTGW